MAKINRSSSDSSGAGLPSRRASLRSSQESPRSRQGSRSLGDKSFGSREGPRKTSSSSTRSRQASQVGQPEQKELADISEEEAEEDAGHSDSPVDEDEGVFRTAEDFQIGRIVELDADNLPPRLYNGTPEPEAPRPGIKRPIPQYFAIVAARYRDRMIVVPILGQHQLRRGNSAQLVRMWVANHGQHHDSATEEEHLDLEGTVNLPHAAHINLNTALSIDYNWDPMPVDSLTKASINLFVHRHRYVNGALGLGLPNFERADRALQDHKNGLTTPFDIVSPRRTPPEYAANSVLEKGYDSDSVRKSPVAQHDPDDMSQLDHSPRKSAKKPTQSKDQIKSSNKDLHLRAGTDRFFSRAGKRGISRRIPKHSENESEPFDNIDGKKAGESNHWECGHTGECDKDECNHTCCKEGAKAKPLNKPGGQMWAYQNSDGTAWTPGTRPAKKKEGDGKPGLARLTKKGSASVETKANDRKASLNPESEEERHEPLKKKSQSAINWERRQKGYKRHLEPEDRVQEEQPPKKKARTKTSANDSGDRNSSDASQRPITGVKRLTGKKRSADPVDLGKNSNDTIPDSQKRIASPRKASAAAATRLSLSSSDSVQSAEWSGGSKGQIAASEEAEGRDRNSEDNEEEGEDEK